MSMTFVEAITPDELAIILICMAQADPPRDKARKVEVQTKFTLALYRQAPTKYAELVHAGRIYAVAEIEAEQQDLRDAQFGRRAR
jgi:hypothetical protein